MDQGKPNLFGPSSFVFYFQEGAIALNVAVDRYDPSRGVRFFTYADWALRAAFEQAVRGGYMAQIDRSIMGLMRKMTDRHDHRVAVQ